MEWGPGIERVLRMLKRVDALNTEKQERPLYGRMHTADFKALVLHHTAHHFHQFGRIKTAPSVRPPHGEADWE